MQIDTSCRCTLVSLATVGSLSVIALAASCLTALQLLLVVIAGLVLVGVGCGARFTCRNMKSTEIVQSQKSGVTDSLRRETRLIPSTAASGVILLTAISRMRQFIEHLVESGGYLTQGAVSDWQRSFAHLMFERHYCVDYEARYLSSVRVDLMREVCAFIKQHCIRHKVEQISFVVELHGIIDALPQRSSIERDIFRLISIIPAAGGEPINSQDAFLAPDCGDFSAIQVIERMQQLCPQTVPGGTNSLVINVLHQGLFAYLYAAGADIFMLGDQKRLEQGCDIQLILDVRRQTVCARQLWSEGACCIAWSLEYALNSGEKIGHITISAQDTHAVI